MNKIRGNKDDLASQLLAMVDDIDKPLSPVTITSKFIMRASSYVTQEPAKTDAPIQLIFGDAQAVPQFYLDDLGNFTCTQSGYYFLRLRLEFGCTNDSQYALILGRACLNGEPLGDPVFAELGGGKDKIPTAFEGVVPFTLGDVLTVEIYRDSQGANAGGIFAFASTLWGDAPSAVMLITQAVAEPS